MTFKPARLLVLLFAIASIPAVAQNLAVVNGKAIPSSRADLMVKQMTAQGQPDSPQLRGAIKEELINREILMQEADKQGLSSSQDVKNQLELARQSIVIRALIADYLKKNPVSDADIKAEYDKFKAQAGDKEYHARHILVDKEEDAKAIIAKLKAGTKFEDLAKQSKDTGSAANGGDLDWATPASFVKPFSDAMVALKKGDITQTPVQTQFGWHVIQLQDVRPAKVPTLDEVKPQIAEALQQKKLQAYQEELRKKAKVQ
ncbi:MULTISPECIES: peptidylprolyl isomerase [unclassified Herbaspirillum]|uniref:peptidylprolyl isomerase n=1 Tax=unclassified Herbaspirillum TaxID=2624150 RepID=UPI0011517120|nr:MULTISPECIES: peptidylprolyl isomerase [unclassified Herbaspirillum]MBB5393180.1 peptidyl-prolyl cis-trans isomerase C [Herbaspirillum sp. SJZ102]TQK04179.1 peptidyl-prolyl cis-trans isomerase C [Herbaspirillum sp. SJZ130]TQK10036.1 peptidyl-prolyl cis-trans isomerase C [Herbaspirillum sp. SJZ106]TWC63608.1 peptidyl-prolyl cis-trans isomerase C [Herbaspirillum sp. SJZ099]